MATMIPDKSREFEANSLEDIMFDELENLLSAHLHLIFGLNCLLFQ